MFWDLVTLLLFLMTWGIISYMHKEMQHMRKDIDNLLMFNRISRYHALNDEVKKKEEDSWKVSVEA